MLLLYVFAIVAVHFLRQKWICDEAIGGDRSLPIGTPRALEVGVQG